MEITAIKQLLTITQVLTHYAITADHNHRITCPFHPDKTPSMQLYPKTNTVYCFSSNCTTHGKSLDVIDFIMHKENISKHEAIIKAQNLLGVITPTKPTYTQLEIIAEPTITKAEFLEIMFSYFKNAIVYSKAARDYLKVRSLDATKLKVGYNTAQFHHGTRRDEALISNAVIYGLLAPWGANTRKPTEQAYKVFGKECIVFAMRNSTNNITGLYFRSTTNNENQKHFYLKESTGLYPNYPNETTEKLIITESIIDAASLLQIESITKNYTILAAYGTNRLNEEMQAAIKALPNLNEIIFAFDNDEAGEKAVSKLANLLIVQLANVSITTIKLPNKDANETLQLHDENIFIELLEERKNIIKSEAETTQKQTQQLQQLEVKSPPSGDLGGLETQNEPAQLFVESTPKPIPTTNNESNNLLNATNPFKITYTTQTAIYYVKGGIDKVLTKLAITLEIENTQLQNAIKKRRFKIDLFDSKQIEKAAQEANEYLELSKNGVAKDLHFLTEALDEYRENEQLKNSETESQEPAQYILTPQEKTEALAIATDKNLMQIITQKLTTTGIIGEDENKTFLFVVAASHIQESPLNALIQGSSGSGKTNLLKGVFKIMPEENKKIYSRCSEKMLYNVPKYYFKNKLVCFEDVDGLGEEAEYAWRELVSSGQLISGVSFKDEKGNIGIKELTVYGPITSIACTTKGAIYTDNMSRLFLIAIDESKAQTQKINAYQAQEAAGQINKNEQIEAMQQLQNFVRLLVPYKVYNPYATILTLPDGIQDERRLYRLYLSFIEMITVLHQHQRQITTTKDGSKKLVTTPQDCQLAKDLMFECIMLKMDELDGSLRQFFERLKSYIKEKNNERQSFTQREIRAALNISKTHLFRNINELVQLEYLQENKYNGNQGNTYQIRYWDDYKKVRQEVKIFLQTQIDNLQPMTTSQNNGTQTSNNGTQIHSNGTEMERKWNAEKA